MVVILVTFVSAKMTPNSLDGYNHDIEVYVEKGWNLILMPIEDNILSDSEVQMENLKGIFFYIPHYNDYFEIYPNDDGLTDFINPLSEDEQVFISITSAWVYSDKKGYLRYSRVDVPKYDEVKLSSGWNFFTLTPELKMKSLNEFKGDCEILKIAFWQAEWSVISEQSLLGSSHPDTPASWGDLILADSDSDTGKGVLIKVRDSCQFGSSHVMGPPPIPN